MHSPDRITLQKSVVLPSPKGKGECLGHCLWLLAWQCHGFASKAKLVLSARNTVVHMRFYVLVREVVESLEELVGGCWKERLATSQVNTREPSLLTRVPGTSLLEQPSFESYENVVIFLILLSGIGKYFKDLLIGGTTQKSSHVSIRSRVSSLLSMSPPYTYSHWHR